MRRDITALRIEPSEGSVRRGAAVQLSLFATTAGGGTDLIPGNMSVWSSSDESVAEVNRQGRLTPRRPGTLTVTARYAGQVAQAAFTVVE